MTQAQFNKKFTKKAFIAFLKTRPKDIQVNGYNCFLGKFADKLFPKSKCQVHWTYIIANGKRLNYPEWASDYLCQLEKLIRVHTPEFAEMARKESIEFLGQFN
jgi:hypothetical protein